MFSTFKRPYSGQESLVVQGLCFYRLLQRLQVSSNTNSSFIRFSLIVTMKSIFQKVQHECVNIPCSQEGNLLNKMDTNFRYLQRKIIEK